MDYERNIHEGHRTRLFETAERVGIENLDKIQALEAILCLVFPRGDVNPLAHRILDKYKNITHAVSAPIEDLVRVKGMGRKSAIKFRTVYGICRVINDERTQSKRKAENYDQICDFIEGIFRYEDKEVCYVLGFGANNDMLSYRPIAEGDVNKVEINLAELIYFITSVKPEKVIIAHNHPNGYCMPSTQDLNSYARLKNLIEFAGCLLVDSMIIGSDGIYSIEYEKMLRIFEKKPVSKELYDSSSDNLENILKDINK